MYTFNSRVRYSETTKDQLLDLYAILNYFQDCSNFQSADLGVGVEYLTEHGQAWLLSAWQVELLRPPHLFDPISIGTWPYGFKGMYGYRNFILYNEARGHEVAACANSIWFLIDIKSGKPLRITQKDAAPYTLEPAYPMEYAPRKITLPDPLPKVLLETTGQDFVSCQEPSRYPKTGYPPVTVTKMFLDTNNHVNNSQYVRLAQACLPETFRIRRMRAEYRRAAVLGDVIYPEVLTSPETKGCYVSLKDEAGNVYAVVEFMDASGNE